MQNFWIKWKEKHEASIEAVDIDHAIEKFKQKENICNETFEISEWHIGEEKNA